MLQLVDTTYYERHLSTGNQTKPWLFITWRLAGSLPEHLRFALDRAEIGPMWLKDARIAKMVCDAIQQAESSQLCRIGACVVMSNHVHLLAGPIKACATVTLLDKLLPQSAS